MLASHTLSLRDGINQWKRRELGKKTTAPRWRRTSAKKRKLEKKVAGSSRADGMVWQKKQKHFGGPAQKCRKAAKLGESPGLCHGKFRLRLRLPADL